MREHNVVGVPFVCEKRGGGWKVIERDPQETEIFGGERTKFLDESMIAQLQQKRTRRGIGVRERLFHPCLGDGGCCTKARKDWDDDFFR